MIKDKYQESKYSYQAVGAEKQNGVVDIIIPSNSKVDNYWHFTAIIYQKIFASNKGKLHLYIDKDGVTQKAVLRDVLLFGDISVERVE